MKVIHICPLIPLAPQVPAGYIVQFRGALAVAARSILPGHSRQPLWQFSTGYQWLRPMANLVRLSHA